MTNMYTCYTLDATADEQKIVRTRVSVRGHNGFVARARSFDDDETKVLRYVARELQKKNYWSSGKLGEAMGIAQQNAGRFVAKGSTSGIDRKTANRLAASAGYRDVEHLLLEAGVLAEMDLAPQGWPTRDNAIWFARRAGYPESAILSVLHRHAEKQHAIKPMRWWMDMIVLESLARAGDVDSEAPVMIKSSGVPKKKRSGTEG